MKIMNYYVKKLATGILQLFIVLQPLLASLNEAVVANRDSMVWLNGLDGIEFKDRISQTNENAILEGRVEISFSLQEKSANPWTLSARSLFNVCGIRGKNVSVETGWSMNGSVSNEEINCLFRQLKRLGVDIPKPDKTSPVDSAGDGWKWVHFSGDSLARLSAHVNALHSGALDDLKGMYPPLSLTFIDHDSYLYVAHNFKIAKCMSGTFVAFCEQRMNEDNFQNKKKSTLILQGDDQPCEKVPLENLLLSPMIYDGKRVTVSGYYHSELEHESLSPEKTLAHNYDKSIWLSGPSTFASPVDVDTARHCDEFISVDGTFNAGPSGHMGLWPGELKRITRVDKTSGLSNRIEPVVDTPGDEVEAQGTQTQPCRSNF